MAVEVAYVTDEWLDTIWNNYSKDHLGKLIGLTTNRPLDSIYRDILTHKLQLWLVLINKTPVASFTSSIEEYEEGKEVVCEYLGGDRMQEWAATAVAVLEQFGKANGCYALATVGRKGTERLYKQWGFELESVRMQRKI